MNFETTIGGKKFQFSRLTVGIQLDVEEWVQRQVLLRASETVTDEAMKVRIMAEAGAVAASVGFASERGQQIRASISANLFLMYCLARECDPKITFDYFKAMFRKHPEDYLNAIEGWRNFFLGAGASSPPDPAGQEGSETPGT